MAFLAFSFGMLNHLTCFLIDFSYLQLNLLCFINFIKLLSEFGKKYLEMVDGACEIL